MSEIPNAVPHDEADEPLTAEEYGGLSVEDEPGTVNPADLAGTATDDDAVVGYEPRYTEGDDPGED